jgi:16S rRNA (cytidine1402-2'-O)-methyltransferase
MTFWGFAPAKQSARLEWLRKIQHVGGLAVIFETPHRAVDSLADCAAVFGQSTPMLFGRELTKQHETLIRDSIVEVQARVAHQKSLDPGSAKGEMVWVFDLGEKATGSTDEAQLSSWAAVLAAEMPASAAAKCLVKMLGVSRDEAYSAVLAAGKHV